MTYRSPKAAAYHAAYRAAHREERAAAERDRRSGDPEAYNAARRARYAEDPSGARAAARRYREPRRDELAARKRDEYPARRLRKYDLTPEAFRDMLVGQAGRCLICLRVPDRDLVPDHDHATGKLRGLLCRACNTVLGFARDDAARLVRAAGYLDRSGTVPA